MKHKDYDKPTVEVIQMQQEDFLIVTSVQTAGLRDYNVHEYYEEIDIEEEVPSNYFDTGMKNYDLWGYSEE